jgi:hypothetical protein
MAKEQLRQSIMDGFAEHVSPIDREIPLSEFKEGLPLRARIGGYLNWLLACTDADIPLKSPYPEMLVDPVKQTIRVIRRYPKGPGAIEYV